MKLTKSIRVIFLLMLFLFGSCSEEILEEFTENQNVVKNEELVIPNGFDFSTHQNVIVNISDNQDYVKYDVYSYFEDKSFVGVETYENEAGELVTDSIYKSAVLNNLIFSGVPINGKLSHNIVLANYVDKIFIKRNDNLKYSSAIVEIINQELNYNHASISGKYSNTKKMNQPTVTDYLYCVNGSGELFQIDPLSGEFVYLSDMPMGSYTCAIDQTNKLLYSIGRSSPYPLMKYSIESNTWETISNLGKGGPRLDYNYRDGLLYFSTGSKLYTYDPSNGTKLGTWNINGLHSASGGDLAFAEDGTLYMCTFSGLYRLEMDDNNEYQSDRISSDNLPFQPTSMTFDSNQELWLANNASSSDLIIMDTQTGGWQYNYGVNANNNSDFERTINDLSTFRIYSDIVEITDTDGDGILDSDDSYPDDANKAFELFTPSKYGEGTIAFEDLWPSKGDYDFNDLAVNYNIITILNAQNLVVQVDFNTNVKSNGSGFTNGFGIEIENLVPSQIESVSGTELKHGYIIENPNGTEADQQNAVIVFFDNSHAMLNRNTTVSVKLTQPISTTELGDAPFNPFIIINKERTKEVHLPNKNTTSLGVKIVEITGIDNDEDGNYLTDIGLPWAINIVHDFKVPKEKVAISEAYNFFNEWATSDGDDYQDWYKDNPGYRNIDKIKY